jgi:hypothetical protein
MALTDLRMIPLVMRKYNWTRGARLMEIWQSRPVAISNPERGTGYGTPVTDVITMDWALGFRRARVVYDSIIRDQLWLEDYAKKEIGGMLLRNGLLMGDYKPKPFGDLSKPATEVHKNHIDYFKVSYEMQDFSVIIDDIVAALGRFAFWVAVAGTIAPIVPNAKYQVKIEELGLYIKDSYDFDGDQYLGSWSDDRFSFDTTPDDMMRVTNETFRDWRATFGLGGDFLVFSDVRREKVDKPATLTVYNSGYVES